VRLLARRDDSSSEKGALLQRIKQKAVLPEAERERDVW